MRLFRPVIASWADWGRCFQDRAAFTPLCMDILRREGLPPLPLTPLTPGTNAVFRSGGCVLKVFYPPQCGRDSTDDWLTEKAALQHAERVGVPVPRLLAAGAVQDRYLFRYLILQFCPGQEAGSLLPGLNATEKAAFAAAVKALLARFDRPPAVPLPRRDLAARALADRRLTRLSPGLAQDLYAMARQYAALPATPPPFFAPVLVHGDCTGENLLVSRENGTFSLRLIDLADCCLAPAWYELPPVVFELFGGDPALVRAYLESGDGEGIDDGIGKGFGDGIGEGIGENSKGNFCKGFYENAHENFRESTHKDRQEAFLDKLLWGLALHEFCAELLTGFLARQGLAPAALPSLAALRDCLRAHFGFAGGSICG